MYTNDSATHPECLNGTPIFGLICLIFLVLFGWFLVWYVKKLMKDFKVIRQHGWRSANWRLWSIVIIYVGLLVLGVLSVVIGAIFGSV